ncbi:hypothetical protein [Thermomonas haemolytica]|uniref:hypothetical protein n=1 Tax=Thermomonas haemolytica TaxID=141949 RepID=UPI00104C7122|nr:hypothetical protein [Thermomonas haemolytica]
MKSLIVLSLLVTSPAFGQEFRNTAIPNAQIGAVLRDVAQWHDMQHPDCPYQKPVGSVVIETKGDNTEEHWSIEACSGKSFTYHVAVFPTPNGGVTDSVSNVDGSPIGGSDAVSPPSSDDCSKTKARFEILNAKEDLTDEEMSEVPQLAADLAACAP